jgi:hypothetical protein
MDNLLDAAEVVLKLAALFGEPRQNLLPGLGRVDDRKHVAMLREHIPKRTRDLTTI